MESTKLHEKVSGEFKEMNSGASYHAPKNDLVELCQSIWLEKKLIISITLILTVLSSIYAINQPNIYRASTLLAPAGDQGGASGLSNMAGQFGGLASLAGINLGGSGTDKTGLALEVLKSRLFIENFIKKYQLLLPLMATEKWDPNTNTLILNDEVYDASKKVWLIDIKAAKKAEPSPWKSYKKFMDIMSVSVDKETGMITLTVEHYSPLIAKQWLIWLVSEINNTMREQDKSEAQRSIDFLSKKLQETQLADMQTVFYQLIEEQTKTIMLAEVSQEYVLKTIDPANTPDENAKPKTALIIAISFIFGVFLSLFIVFIRFTLKLSSVN